MAETNYNRPQVDPYGYAMRKIVSGLAKGLQYPLQMSEAEFTTLQELKGVIERNDPEAWEGVRRDKR